MDESDGLENRYGGNLIVGSNPTPSASFRHKSDPADRNLRGSFAPKYLAVPNGVTKFVINSVIKF